MNPFRIVVLLAICWLASISRAGELKEKNATVLFGDQTVKFDKCLVDGDDLWVPLVDVKKVNGFDAKPQGLCSKDLCIPIPKSDDWSHTVGDRQYLNVTRFANKVDQAVAADTEHGVWSFGTVPMTDGSTLSQGKAPDFTLPDRSGKHVRLSDYRGKKVLVLTWASWCACSKDLPGWQTIYQDLKDKNFEILAVAEDTGGEAAAGKYYDAAKATFTTLIDEKHTVSSLYQMVNVPTGVWIDEMGEIVRPPEVAYSKEQQILGTTIGDNRYIAGLRDWVAHGQQSKFVVPPDKLHQKLSGRSTKLRQADAEFKLGVYFHQAGDKTAAEKHWQLAQQLHPESWNYHRQDWSFEPASALRKWFAKYRTLGDKPYYEPIDLPRQ